MKKQFFITGTDTSIGKTRVTGLLARHYQNKGYSVLTQKWIQSGLDGSPTDLESHHTYLSLSPAVISAYKNAMCPYTFSYPASPHLSAQHDAISINPHRITTAYHALAKQCDVLLVEGSGGFLVPYSDHDLMSDIVVQLQLSVIIVIGNKLGCINHALLTIEAVQKRQLAIHGLIFNTIDPKCSEDICENNRETILKFSNLPCLGNLPFMTESTALESPDDFLKTD